MVRSVLLALLVLAAGLLLVACGGESAPPRTALTPFVTEAVPNPVELNKVTETDATETARLHLVKPRENVGATELPRDPIARLMTLDRLTEWQADKVLIPEQHRQATPDTLVWAVQFEGIWVPDRRAAASEPGRFAVVAVDSRQGDVVAAVWATEPLLTPRRLRAQPPSPCVIFRPEEAQVQIGPTQATEAVRAGASSRPPGKFGDRWEYERADAQLVRCVDTVKGVDYLRFNWLVTLPSEMALHDCSIPSVRKVELQRSCWSPVSTHLVSGLDGSVTAVGETGLPGPLVTSGDLEAIRTYAKGNGWWSIWGRLSTFNDSIVPPERLAEVRAGSQ
ncbi:MAG: hypothetical protein HY682_03685 [Chloroflexi bacterium]|nr:hypothetical protein [Chloroflexota bacterium]